MPDKIVIRYFRVTQSLAEFEQRRRRVQWLGVIDKVRRGKRLMQVVEAVSISRYKSSEHLDVESRLLISESDRAVKESPSKMIEFDGGLKVLVHLNLAERRCIPSFDRQKSRI